MSAEKQILGFGIEDATVSEAIQHLDGDREGHDVAVLIGSRYFTLTKGEFGRLQEAGVDMTTWHDLHGMLVCVPGRSGQEHGRPTMNATNQHEHLPTGTRVLNNTDGEPGVVLNGFAFDPAAGWTEYEVETQHGIERWQRADIAVMMEFEDDEAADVLFPAE